MAGVTNSSIQPWLDFLGSNLPAAIPACQTRLDTGGRIGLSKCTNVCNDTVEMLQSELPTNLLTCGLWSSLTMLDYYTTLGDDIGPLSREQVDTLLGQLTHLGLNASNATYAHTARDAVSTCLSIMNQVTRIQTYLGNTSVEGACSEQVLFPRSHRNFRRTLHDLCKHV